MSGTPCDFAQIFSRRRNCFAALRDLSDEQRRMIGEDDYTALLALQGQKLRVIGELEAIGTQHPALMREWRTVRGMLPPAARSSCEELLLESEGLLAELLEQERNDTQTLTARRTETQRQLQGLTTGAKAQQAYTGDRGVASHRVLDIGQ